MILKDNIMTLERRINDLLAFDDYQYEDIGIFIRKICKEYGEFFGYSEIEIFDALESKRTYWYVNYYQEANFPELDTIKVFKNKKEMFEITKPDQGFRCPNCNGVSKHPYICDSGIETDLIGSEQKGICNWKSYGFLRTLGQGLIFTIKENWIQRPYIDESFMPIAMENL